MKPCVAHLLPEYNPFPPVYAAGTELRVEQVARRQVRYRPIVLCRAFPGEESREQIDAMTVRRIPIGRVYRRLFQKLTRWDPWPYAERMWRMVREEKAALLHIHNEPKLLAALHGHIERQPIPTVVHVANEKPLPMQALSAVTRWVACSEYIRHWIAGHPGIDPDRIVVIRTGAEIQGRPSIAEIAESDRNAIRRQYGVDSAMQKVLVFAGRLVKEKGVRELLDAFEILRAKHGDNIRLLIAGNVRESNDPGNEKAVYGKSIVSRIREMSGVRWVGSLKPAQVHQFLLAGDVFVMPSIWHDPFPTAMLEAAAAGLPIVAAARGGITEFLQDCPDFEFLQDPQDPMSIASATEAYLGSAARRETAGRWLRKTVEERYAWTRVRDEFENLYDELLSVGGSRAMAGMSR